MSSKNQILQGQNKCKTKVISLWSHQIIMNLPQKFLLFVDRKIWNSLPINIKSAETFEVFKKLFLFLFLKSGQGR